MKITDFAINMDYSRSFKREQTVKQSRLPGASKNLSSNGFLVEDRVSISETASNLNMSAKYFSLSGESLVSRIPLNKNGKDPGPAQKTILASMVSSLTQSDVSIKAVESISTPSKNFIRQPLEVTFREVNTLFEKEEATLFSSGMIRTEDGREINFNIQLQMERSFKSASEMIMKNPLIDPIVITFNGSPPEFSDTLFSFDLNADGETEDIASLKKGSGFLALDHDMNGKIDDGTELFGPSTGNGFFELAQFDKDGNMWIDENDEVFERLSIWTPDQAGDYRMISLKQAGIGAISLHSLKTGFSFTDDMNRLQGELNQTGVYVKESGEVHYIYQLDMAAHTKEDEKRLSVTRPEPQSFISMQANRAKSLNINPFFIGIKLSSREEPEPVTIYTFLEKMQQRIEKLKEAIKQIQEEGKKIMHKKS
ncbi:hypothetical protein [Desulfobacula toluolica]|nr:hypothetical protein [Desulfobacula toluolica]